MPAQNNISVFNKSTIFGNVGYNKYQPSRTPHLLGSNLSNSPQFLLEEILQNLTMAYESVFKIYMML